MKKEKTLAIENEQERAKRDRQRKLRHKKHMRFWDRLAGFIIVLVLVVGCSCLGLESWVQTEAGRDNVVYAFRPQEPRVVRGFRRFPYTAG